MAAMSHTESISGYPSAVAAEEAFYRAFRELSFLAMERVWARDEVACLHPGGELLTGRRAVMDSWARILNAAEPPQMEFARDMQQADGAMAVHMVREMIAPGVGQQVVVVRAVNGYRRLDDRWYMVLHHASLPMTAKITAPRAAGASPTLQ